MKKIVTLLLISLALSATGQDVYTSSGKPVNKKKKQQEKGFDISKLVVGGGLGLGFGDVTSIAISPVVGYRFTDHFAAGVGFGYQYFKVKDFFELTDANGYTSYYDYKSSIISASVWARYLILTQLFVQAEYEHNFMSFRDYRFAQNGSGTIEPYDIKYDAPALLLGIGYRQPIGEYSSFYIMGMYDVLQDKYSPYYGRIFPRLGFTLGF